MSNEEITMNETTGATGANVPVEDVGHGDDHHGSEDSSRGHEGNDSEQDTFPRSYVERLRKESAGYRERAGQADELAKRLHAALVAADGRLADPADLEFNPEHLEDEDALQAAITELVERKPGLRAQKVTGDVGQGKRGSDPGPTMDLLQIMQGL